MKIYTDPLSDVNRYIENKRDVELNDKRRDYENLLAYLRPFRTIDSTLKMLEVGTGTGWFPLLCKKDGLNCKGLEISPQLVEYARDYGRRNGIDCEIELGNLEETDLSENQYDIIITSSVFEHVEDWESGLRKVFRALRPGGLLFFESTNKWSLTSGEYPQFPIYGWMPNAWRYRFRIWVQGPDIMKLGIDFHQFTYPRLRRAFRRVGFSKWYDRVEIADASRVKHPLKRAVLNACKKSRLIKEVILTFMEVTTFVCIK